MFWEMTAAAGFGDVTPHAAAIKPAPETHHHSLRWHVCCQTHERGYETL